MLSSAAHALQSGPLDDGGSVFF